MSGGALPSYIPLSTSDDASPSSRKRPLGKKAFPNGRSKRRSDQSLTSKWLRASAQPTAGPSGSEASSERQQYPSVRSMLDARGTAERSQSPEENAPENNEMHPTNDNDSYNASVPTRSATVEETPRPQKLDVPQEKPLGEGEIPEAYLLAEARVKLLSDAVRRETPGNEAIRLDLLHDVSQSFVDGQVSGLFTRCVFVGSRRSAFLHRLITRCSFLTLLKVIYPYNLPLGCSHLARAVREEVRSANKRAGGRRRRATKQLRKKLMQVQKRNATNDDY